MADITLVVGGCRSGKSAYAQSLAESLSESRLYVATCPVIDAEMEQRIAWHRAARRDRGWQTIEEPLDLAGVFRAFRKRTVPFSVSPSETTDENRDSPHGVLLVDCITLWVNNLMYAADQDGRPLEETQVADRCRQVLEATDACRGAVIFVSNEVGQGIVPDNAQARRYRDLVGRANQILAARAERVTLLSCGIPLHLKETRK